MISLSIYFLAFIASSFFIKSSSGNQTVYEFTKLQNDLTEEYIQSYKTSDGSSVRDKIWDVLDSISEFSPPTYKIPEKFGNRYFFYGGMNRVFMRESLKSMKETQVLKVASFLHNKISKDGNFLPYSSFLMLKEILLKNITSGQDIETISAHDHTLSWNKDSTGFIYMHEEKPKRAHKAEIHLKFHKIGTDQSSDVFIANLSPVENGLTVVKYIYPKLTSDDNYIILTKQTASAFNLSDLTYEYLYTEYDNINWRQLRSPSKHLQSQEPLESDQTHPNIIYIKVFNLTSSSEEKVILKMDLNSVPVTEEIIAEGWKEPYKNRGLSDACIINGDKLMLSSVDYLNKRFTEKGILEVKDLKTFTTLYKKTEVASNFKISCSGNEVLIQKSLVGLPNSHFVLNFSKSPLEMVEFNVTVKPQPEVLEKLRDYETTVDTYRTKDATKLPIYIVHKKGFVPQGNSPVMVIPKTRSPLTIPESAFLGMFDGILAVPMYRQIKENGYLAMNEEPVDAQTSLDDVISSVEYLIQRNYTSPGKVFLTYSDAYFNRDVNIPMAVLTRPELFAGAFISDGILDLVKSTNKTEFGIKLIPLLSIITIIPKSSVQDTGYCFNQTVLEKTMRMSPLENIKQGVKYPPQLIRYKQDKMEEVHSYLRKINATSKESPVLITTAGSQSQWMISTENKNQGNADTLAFAAKVLGLSWKL